MSHALPTTNDAVRYFAKFREMKERNRAALAGNAAPATAEAATTGGSALVTQVEQNASQPSHQGGIGRIVPMDLSTGTKEERLQKLRTSPKNMSPNLPQKDVWSLLPMPTLDGASRVTLVLDVDETLVHSSFEPKEGVKYDVKLDIVHQGTQYGVFVKFRPYLKEFLEYVSSRFEIVIFTASLSAYCNALMDYLDPDGRLGQHRLFREHCTKHPIQGTADTTYVKDLCLLGRDLGKIAIVDNSPNAYLYQQRNAIPIASFFQDENDSALRDLIPLLRDLSCSEMVYDVLDVFNATGRV